MRKRLLFLVSLTAGFLACLVASQGLAKDDYKDYGSYESYNPSKDFKRSTSKPPATPPPAAAPPAETRRPAASGMDLPAQGASEPYPPAVEERAPAASGVRPAHSGFDLSEPGTYEAVETAPAISSPPPAATTHTGFDLTDPRARETYPAATEEAPAAAPAPVAAPVPVRAVETAPAVPVSNAPPVALSEAVNYSLADNWLALPASPDRSVDVFFLYTGSCARVGQGGAVCSPNDPGMRQKAGESLRRQAGVFEPIANIYAPYYRQVNSSIFLGLGADDRSERLAVSVADSIAAFDYYLKSHNKGRPFILAAHGQGSAALLSGVLANYLKANPEARNRLVAAYALGYSVTSDYLSANTHLRFAQRRNDTGVIISYNTEAPGLTVSNPALLPRAVAINPITWVRSEIPVKAERSLGANLSAFGGEEQVEKFADARISLRRGVVECSTADANEYSNDLFPFGAYPGGDYAFYYYDLRANAQERVDAFRQSRGQ